MVVESVGGVEEDGEDQDMLEEVCSDDERRKVVLELFFKKMGEESRDDSKDNENS